MADETNDSLEARPNALTYRFTDCQSSVVAYRRARNLSPSVGWKPFHLLIDGTPYVALIGRSPFTNESISHLRHLMRQGELADIRD